LWGRLAVDFSAVAHPNNVDGDLIIFDSGYDPIVAYPVFPIFSQTGTFERFSYTARRKEMILLATTRSSLPISFSAAS
jgi:hypothetical protein